MQLLQRRKRTQIVRALDSIASHEQSVPGSNEQFIYCHMCQDSKSLTTLHQLEDPIDVVLGDGRALTAVGREEVVLNMVLLNGESKLCMLHDVLYVAKLSYNLLSVAKASQRAR